MKKLLALLLVLVSLVSPALAADTPYTTFVTGATQQTPTGAELLGLVNSGTNTVQATTMQISELNSVVPTQAPYYASGFIALATTNGSVTSGSTVIPVNTTTGFSAGQIVMIALGGTSGTKNFCGTIASVSAGTSITLSTTAVSGNFLLPEFNCTSGTSLTTTVPGNYYVVSLGMTSLSGAASSGATSISVTNATSYLKNQGLFLYGCGAAGANLLTQITNVSGNTLTISPGIGNAGGCASGTAIQHDDTTALQSAINQASLLKSLRIFLPDGAYQINGAAQNTGTANAILQVPTVNYYNSGATFWSAQITLEITGNTPAPQMQSYLNSTSMTHWTGALILTNQSTGASIIGGYNSGQYQNFTNVQLVLSNLTMRDYPNPNMTKINAGAIQSLKLNGVDVDTGETGAITQPTHAVFGVVFPLQGNGGNHIARNVEIMGQYYGIAHGEHMNYESLRFDADFIPVYMNQGGGYGWICIDCEFNGCTHGLYVAAETYHPIAVFAPNLNIEHPSGGPAWMNNVDDIYDPNNYLTGQISADIYVGGFLNVNGAANVEITSRTLSGHQAYPFDTATYSQLTTSSHYTGAPNGTQWYCPDCVIASTCAGSGTGAMAKKLNGVLVCN